MKGFRPVFFTLLIFSASTAFAGRPLAIDDADPVEQGQFEFELGTAYEQDSSCDAWEVPFGLTAGILPGVEAGIGFGGLYSDEDDAQEHGIGDLTAGIKWQFLPEKGWLPAQALAAAIKFPTADDDKDLGSGKTDYDLTWIASKRFGEKTGLHLNAGYTWIGVPSGEDGGDLVHYGAALDYQLTDTVQWVGEVFAEKELQGGTQTIVQCNTGFRWNPSESLTLDMAVGTSLRGDDAPDFTATAGLTWAFDLQSAN